MKLRLCQPGQALASSYGVIMPCQAMHKPLLTASQVMVCCPKQQQSSSVHHRDRWSKGRDRHWMTHRERTSIWRLAVGLEKDIGKGRGCADCIPIEPLALAYIPKVDKRILWPCSQCSIQVQAITHNTKWYQQLYMPEQEQCGQYWNMGRSNVDSIATLPSW